MNDEELLAEIEDILRSAPTIADIDQYTSDSNTWLGRTSGALHLWNTAVATVRADSLLATLTASTGEKLGSYRMLTMFLHRAKTELRMKTTGPISEHIEAEKQFEYFDNIREIIQEAVSEIFFIDPYLDAEFVKRYLPQVKEGVRVRLLTYAKLSLLVPAVEAFVAQEGTKVEIRSSPKIHDRHIFIDEASCYQSGASFKDGAKKASTTITQITDAFAAVRKTYEDIWETAKEVEVGS
jgi:hypothetical protein